MTNENLRFAGADWYSTQNAESVIIGGAGGIGSWLAFALARANFRIILMDFDKIEEQNMGGQLYRLNQIGGYKATALHDILKSYTSNAIEVRTEKFTESSPTHEFMAAAFDNMEARRTMFNVWKKSWNKMNSPLFIDGRLNMEGFQIFCVTPDTADKYEMEYLFSDEEVENAACSMQQTTHTAMMIGGHMTAFFTNHITNIHLRNKIREVPFMYEYFTPMNLTITV